MMTTELGVKPRAYFEGMGNAVADRTINRTVDGVKETWGDVAKRVAHGNTSLFPYDQEQERIVLEKHLAQASTLMSGRHLQHGDENQRFRPMEVFSNCSSAMLRFLTFKLLLSGSGVGSSYDDDLMVVDWAKYMPNVVCVIDPSHPDAHRGDFGNLRDTLHFYQNQHYVVHHVDDSREGWAKVIELIEQMTFDKVHQDTVLIVDFTKVRHLGQPIKGMQNRPSSGPIPLMKAITKLACIKGSAMPPWKAAMYADHLLAECVLVGGARRAARIAIKHWKDKSIFDFINIKRPPEFVGRSRQEIQNLRESNSYLSFLWSANNSVGVDKDFWHHLERAKNGIFENSLDSHAWLVWMAITECQYADGTGEPGFLNVDKLEVDETNLDMYRDTMFAGSNLYQPNHASKAMIFDLTERVLNHCYHYIVNPCGEISFFMLGAFCVIADTVPFHARNDDDAEEAFRVNTRALMRVNLMNSIYANEVWRTNRIGVGITGLHEYMWARFGLGFRDAIELGDIGPMGVTEKSKPFWDMIARFSDAVDDEAEKYAAVLGVNVPHTNKTMKPAGTTSKLFGLTEAAHLASMRKLLRWVQFRNDDPLVQTYIDAGYPVRQLKSYSGTTIVGFPTAPVITTMGMGDKLVTANEATPDEQFRWLQLLEYFWLGTKGKGNQISYTLKYEPSKISFSEYEKMMFENVKKVRAVSVMPFEDKTSYEYLPEEPITDDYYDYLVSQIRTGLEEDVDQAHVECSTGGCPIDFNKSEAA